MFKTTFSKLALFATILALVVVILGAYTRLTDAGLGCPDWPGCYGQLTPPSNTVGAIHELPLPESFDESKAWTEMVHRYFAGTLGLVILALTIVAIKKRKQQYQQVALPFFILGLVIFQALLGMWTVTLLLNPLVVMAHLLGGMATLGFLWWLTLSSSRVREIPPNPPLKKGGWGDLKTWATLGLIILALQIALGAWTSANYAALACPDFPQCQGQWWPKMDFSGAFTVWKQSGSNFDGGVLSNESRTTIQMMHRIGALITLIFLAGLAFKSLAEQNSKNIKFAGIILFLVLITQVSLGISTVLLIRPLDVALAHNGVAAILLLTVITLNNLCRPQKT